MEKKCITIKLNQEAREDFQKLKKLLNLLSIQAKQLEKTLNEINNTELTIDFEVSGELRSAEIHSGTVKASTIHSAHLLQ